MIYPTPRHWWDYTIGRYEGVMRVLLYTAGIGGARFEIEIYTIGYYYTGGTILLGESTDLVGLYFRALLGIFNDFIDIASAVGPYYWTLFERERVGRLIVDAGGTILLGESSLGAFQLRLPTLALVGLYYRA